MNNSRLLPRIGGLALPRANWIQAGCGIGLGALFCLRALSTEPYALDASLGATGKDVQLWVPTNGLVSVGIARLSASAPAQAALQLSAFRGEYDGRELSVRLLETNLAFPPNQVFGFATLQVAPIRAPQKYSGTLALSTNGAPAVVWRITLNDANLSRPAALVVEPVTLKHRVAQAWFFRPKAGLPEVTVSLSEKSGRWPVEGLGVSLVSVTAPERASFDLARNVTFFLGTNPVRSLTGSVRMDGPERDLRTIPAGGNLQLGFGFRDLKPGQYTVELKFFALNASLEAQPRLTLTLQKADPVWLALLTLLAALFLSFFSYKWLKLYGQRLLLRKRIADLRPGWLSYRDPAFSVVWVRTVLKQAERLTSRTISLLPPALVAERIDRVPPVLEALDQAGKAEEQLQRLRHMPRHRLEAVIAKQVRSISDHNMDKEVAGKARAALAALNSELADNRWFARYAAEVHQAATAFLRGFDDKAMPDESAQLVARIKNGLEESLDTIEAKTEQEVIDYDEAYARLKLLYECRRYEEFPDLLKNLDWSLEDLFRLADDATWERIKRAPIRIHSSDLDANESLEAFRPLKFYLTTGDKDLNATYLFNRGLHFQWHFTLVSGKRRVTELHPKTHSPRVAQFAPRPGILRVSVEIVRELPSPKDSPSAKPKTAEMEPVPVGKSSDLGFMRGVELTEWCALGVAALLAIVSGLLTFYYKNPTFGSVEDYLGLFLWGVGVEQTKNFLQALQSPAKDASG